MSEPARIAAVLSDGDDLAAAALLIAAYASREPVIVPREDADLWGRLRRLGCVEGGQVTPLGAMVAMRLMAAGVVEHPRGEF